MSNEHREVAITITHQGAPRVSHAYVYAEGGPLVVVDVDMDSKRCEVDAITDEGPNGAPCVCVGTNEDSLGLDPTKERGDPTYVEFPGYAGYEVLMATLSRYTLRVCLMKREDGR